MLRLLSLLLISTLGACAEPGPEPGPEPDVRPAYVLGPVLLEQQTALATALDLGSLPEPADIEQVRGLVYTRAKGSARFKELPLEDIKNLGASAIAPLATVLLDDTLDFAERVAAAELLGYLDLPLAAERLLERIESASEPWLRSWCAFHLSQTTQDHVLPRLLLRLKYEKDHEAYCWIAVALLRRDNFTALEGLMDLAGRDGNPAQASAQNELNKLTERLQLEPAEILRQWHSLEATQLPQHTPSKALRARIWERVSQLSGEHFQLRGVDDALYILERLGPWAALEITPALGDEDIYVRLHVAQALERMGSRASLAGAALLNALHEPRMAPAAAEALGRVGVPEAKTALLELLQSTQDYELQVAIARALGRLGFDGTSQALIECFDGALQPGQDDLRLTCAAALVLLDQGDRVAHYLLDVLQAGGPPSAAAATALETWLVQGAAASRTGFIKALATWRESDAPPGTIPSSAKAAERRAKRAAQLAPQLQDMELETSSQ
ncbi:MAG: HEAT repeat protein [Planctomycetota bacterium]|jgi:HEAT repeat protein